MPSKIRNAPIKKCFTKYDPSSRILYLTVNESEGYSISCWKYDCSLSLLFQTCLEPIEPCRGLFLSSHGVCTIERNAFKFWVCGSNAKLIGNYNIKKEIIEADMGNAGNICLLTSDGIVILCTYEGKYISSFSNENYKFTALKSEEDLIVLGTSQGKVEVYQLSTLGFVKKIEYPKQKINRSTVNTLCSYPQVANIILSGITIT